MTPKEIIGYNRRCAEFLELELSGPGFPSGYFYKENYYHFDDLKFHSDWNWIMEVLKHIREIINVELTIHDFECVREMKLCLNPFDYDKEAVVQAINQFLIWYESELPTHA